MTVALLGCGYVGLELGKQLTAAGHDVVGVRRSADGCAAIEAAGFTPVRADISDDAALESVPDADVVVFAASSGGRDADAAREIYVDAQKTVLSHFAAREASPDRYIYTSSTGVYGDHGGDWVDEETPLNPTTAKTEVLATAEEVALTAAVEHGMDGTVARYAGLYGPGRFRIERYLNGPVTEGYLNLLHRDDAAEAVAHLIEQDLARNEVVLVVDDEPVSRWELADWLAKQCGEPEPEKQTVQERLAAANLSERGRRRILSDKRCSNAYLRDLGYEFRYPTYREGYQAAIDNYVG